MSGAEQVSDPALRPGARRRRLRRWRTVEVVALLLAVVTGGACAAKHAGGSDAAEQPLAGSSSTTRVVEERPLDGTARTKTFDFDPTSVQTGTGDVSSVGMVQLTIGDAPARSGARVATGEFTGSALQWTLDDRIFLEEGSLHGSGSCDTTTRGSGLHTSCQLHIVGGTGAYERARGRYGYECAVPSADIDVIVTCDLAGHVGP